MRVLFTTCNRIRWNGAMFVAVGTGNFSAAYSYDGIIWYGSASATSICSTGLNIAWNGNYWIATVTPAGGIYFINAIQSTDGINWMPNAACGHTGAGYLAARKYIQPTIASIVPKVNASTNNDMLLICHDGVAAFYVVNQHRLQ